MCSKQFRFVKLNFVKLNLICVGIPTFVSMQARAQTSLENDAPYFGGRDLDYWNEGKRVQKSFPSTKSNAQSNGQKNANLPPPTGSIIRQRDALPFDWKNYENPSSPEFWDDGGEYVAPRPLREAVANPTKENVDKYLDWQAKRLEVLATFNQKVANQALSGLLNQAPVPNSVSGSATTRQTNVEVPAPQRKPIPWREIELLYFYQTSCPHCRESKPVVEELVRRGVRVSFIQMDADKNPPMHTRSVPYSRRHSEQFAVTSTPTWIFRRRNEVLRLSGSQSLLDLESEAQKLSPSP